MPGYSTLVASMLGTLPGSGPHLADSPRAAAAALRAFTAARTTSTAVALTTALLVVDAVAAVAILIAPTILRDPAGYAGNALGTYVVVLLVAIPTLALAMRAAVRGSLAARFVWLGGVAYLLYNAILSSFSLQFNELFLVYVASLSLAVWSLVAVLATIDVPMLPARLARRFPARLVGGYLMLTAVGFAAIWMRDILPATLLGQRPPSLRGTTLPVNVVHVIDLAFTLPVSFAAGLWVWRRRPWGILLAGLMLVALTIESVSVAVDQWVGHRADLTQPAGTVALFVVLAAIGALPTLAFLSSIVPPPVDGSDTIG